MKLARNDEKVRRIDAKRIAEGLPMRVSEAALALFKRLGVDSTQEYLTQWNDAWQMFALVGGHVEPGESFHQCCVREVEEELYLIADVDFEVGPRPLVPKCVYTAMSGSKGVETRYCVELFPAEFLHVDAEAKVNSDLANRWLTEAEVRRLVTVDNKPVSAQVETVLKLCGVIAAEN
jgi:8-oxo-dGTP pyrophosphatase MutT (NUDIX family)